MFDSGAYYYSMILLQPHPVATFLGLLFNDSTAVSVDSDFPRILYENDSAAVSAGNDFPRILLSWWFTAILYGSDIPKKKF